jgi:TonB-dependent SusC/RagA subfamily outer membrane receptor
MEYLLKASAAIAIFYLCFYFFLKKETFFQHNRWFLFAGLLIATLFPFITIPIYIPIEPVATSETSFILAEYASEHINTTVAEQLFNWTSLIPIIYGLGLTVFFIQFLFQFGSLIRLLIKNPKAKDGIYTYVIVENKMSPFSFFKWIVYNPETYTHEELEFIFKHEKVHVNQLHSIDTLIAQLACVVFWFNPLIWLYRKQVLQNLEFIADHETQNISKNKKHYQRLLLKTSTANNTISLSTNFYNSLIKERIVMLQKSRSNTKKQWRYLLILPLLAGLLMSMNTETVYVETEPTIKSANEIVEFVVHKNTSDSELKNMSNTIEIKGSSLFFSDITRNNANEITNITVKLSGTTYKTSSDTAIDSFIVYKEFFEENGSFVGRYGNGTIHLDTVIGEPRDNPRIKLFTDRVNTTLLRYNLTDKVEADSNYIEITFNNKMTDEQLDDIKNELKSNGVTMTIKKIRRNSKGLISTINIDFKTKNSSTNYKVKDANGINPFYFKMDDDGSFGVGAINATKYSTHHNITADTINSISSKDKKKITYKVSGGYRVGNVKNSSSSDSGKSYYQNGFNRDTTFVINDFIIDSSEVQRLSKLKSNIYYEDNSPISIITSGKQDLTQPSKITYYKHSFYDDENTKPLFILDGKIVSSDISNNLNPNNIEKIDVLKGKNATDIYGKKAKNGAIVIVSKNKNIWIEKSKNDNDEPLKIGRVEVTSTFHADDEDLNPIIIVNGKVSSEKEMKALDPNSIAKMDVLKGNAATELYGEKGENGVIVITTKENPWKISYDLTTKDVTTKLNSGIDNYLYILDGKEISKSDLEKVYSKETISSLDVLQGEKAIEKYGNKGINGVVEITSKKIANQKKNPWVISYSTTYIDTDDTSKNGTMVYINKNSQDFILENQKKILDKHGIKVKYSKIKRNKNGEITSIKITLKNNTSDETSGTYKNNNGITNIEYGISEDKLIVRTSSLKLD